MAIGKTTKMANRYGVNLKIYPYAADGEIATPDSPLVTIDYANEISVEITGEITWATGGRSHANLIGFKDPSEGTMTISTQIVPLDLLAIVAGEDPSATTTKVTFAENEISANPTPYIITGETVWQGEDGTIYNETITAFKAFATPDYNVTYTGEGDPQSIDVTFNLATNEGGKMFEILRADRQDDTQPGGGAGGGGGEGAEDGTGG